VNFFRAAFPDRGKDFPLTRDELALRRIDGMRKRWITVVKRMHGNHRRQNALDAINLCLRSGEQKKSFWDRQQVLTSQLRRWAIARGQGQVVEVNAFVKHLQSLSLMASRYRTHRAQADSDAAAFESLRSWYSLQDEEPDLCENIETFQEELAIAGVWEELVRTKETPDDSANEAEERAREALRENFRRFEKSNLPDANGPKRSRK
jgi:hypothetical protein